MKPGPPHIYLALATSCRVRRSAATARSGERNGRRRTILSLQFEVRRRAYIAADGTVVADLPSFASDRDLLVSLYRAMMLTRTFDLRAVSLQRTGRLGTYAVSLGQEASCNRSRQRDARGRRASAFLSRQWRTAMARGGNGEHSPLLGRRRTRQQLVRPNPGFSILHSCRLASPASRRGCLRVQSTERKLASQYASLAMVRRQRAMSGRR